MLKNRPYPRGDIVRFAGAAKRTRINDKKMPPANSGAVRGISHKRSLPSRAFTFEKYPAVFFHHITPDRDWQEKCIVARFGAER
jgi:hypothetical protein